MSQLPRLIIVNGRPATGKTSLAKRLGENLKIPVIHKDALKETLFDQLGYSDREQSKKLGSVTYALLYKLMESFLAGSGGIIIEANFSPVHDRPHFQKIQEKVPFQTLEIFCHCPAETIIQRFSDRAHSKDRHPGHSDIEFIPEFTEKILNNPPLEPLNLENSTLLRVDTTDFSTIDDQSILEEALRHLGQK